MQLDKWQEKVLATKGHMCICSPRQMGKSTIISKDAGDYALKNRNKSIMVIASTERQAFLLFEKILSYIYLGHKSMIMTGVDKPTKKRLKLKNGSVIHCLPTGDTGYGIRGYTIDRLYADEAAFIKEDVWSAVVPMLATTGGEIVLLSTPFGTENYFYRCFHDDNFTSIHVNAEEVLEGRPEIQRENMLEHREEQKTRMTKLQFQQEYEGLFVGGLQRFISDEEIEEICVLDPKQAIIPQSNKFLGVDIAREGGDETVLISVERRNKKSIKMFGILIPEPQKIPETARLISHKDKQINYKKIYMDDGGLGVGVYDLLLEDRQTKRKIVALNNARRVIDKENKESDKDRKKQLYGIDMSIHLKTLIEQGKIKLLDTPELRQSLRSMIMEYENGVLRIHGTYSHCFEALKRAVWCMKDKSLNICISFS